jgi:hypothetical protein
LPTRPGAHRIEIRLRELNQRFNSTAPSPFFGQDLDPRAHRSIVGKTAIHHCFQLRTDEARLSFRRLMRQQAQPCRRLADIPVSLYSTDERAIASGPASAGCAT